jgi:hypothetical protein
MWKFFTVTESGGIHLPDLSSPAFHCFAKQSPYDPEPNQIVVGEMHPTIQFKNLDFFTNPNVHVRMKLLADHGGQDRVIMDGYYAMPPKSAALNVLKNEFDKVRNGTVVIPKIPLISSIDQSSVMLKSNLPVMEMKTICVPPDGQIHRMMVTVNSADEHLKDVSTGPIGFAVVDFKHKFPPTLFGNAGLYELNKTSFF